MEKELDQYRTTLKLQTGLFTVGALVLLTFLLLGAQERIVPVTGGQAWSGAWNGFLMGCSSSLAAVMAAGTVRNLRALRNREKLRKLYIKTHDERTMAIFYRAGHSSYWFDAFGLLVATVVAGYFHPLVALTCLGCTLYICLVRLFLKLYYNRVL